MLLSLVLYGSRARGDHRPKSDVDLLGVVEEGAFKKEIAAGGTSLYHYPALTMLNKSKEGDLFILHLVQEGKVLHDTFGVFRTIKNSFVFKSSYSELIEQASAIIHFFLTREKLLVQKDARKRLIWAIRTILIARCAEEQRACFSSAALASFSKISDLKDVIDNRNLNEAQATLKVASKVLSRFGSETWKGAWPTDPSKQRKLLEELGGIARDTLKFVQPLKMVKGKLIRIAPPIQFSANEYF